MCETNDYNLRMATYIVPASGEVRADRWRLDSGQRRLDKTGASRRFELDTQWGVSNIHTVFKSYDALP
jgi:hypothetical protein